MFTMPKPCRVELRQDVVQVAWGLEPGVPPEEWLSVLLSIRLLRRRG